MILTGETEVLGEKHYTAWVVDEWMSMEQWWNDTDRGNWSAGRETLYSVSGRWMNECGVMVEWYWQGNTEVPGEKPVIVPLSPPQMPHWLVSGWTRVWVTHTALLMSWNLPVFDNVSIGKYLIFYRVIIEKKCRRTNRRP